MKTQGESHKPLLSLKALRCDLSELAVSTGFSCGPECVTSGLVDTIWCGTQKNPQPHPEVLEPREDPMKGGEKAKLLQEGEDHRAKSVIRWLANCQGYWGIMEGG